MTRDEYLCDTRPHAKRGEDLPHAKLTANEVLNIRAAAIVRRIMRAKLRSSESNEDRQKVRNELKLLTNEALAEKYGVSVPCIEKVLSYGSWGHVA